LCRSAAVALIPSGTGPIRPSAFKIEIQVAHESLRNKADAIQCAREQHGDPTRTYLMNHTEETLVLIKPDALERGLAGEIIRRFEAAGLRIHNVRWVSPSLALVEKHYADLKSKNPRAFDRNTRYLAKKNAIALVLAGINAIAKVRMLIGPTEPGAAPPGTIRCDLSSDTIKFADSQDRGLYNLVHAADSADSARREIELWFG